MQTETVRLVQQSRDMVLPSAPQSAEVLEAVEDDFEETIVELV